MKYVASYVRERNGRWQALLKYKGDGGEDKFLSKTLDGVCGKREAKAAAELWRDAENNKARLGPSGSIDAAKTVAQYMDEYVEALRESESLEHSTIIGYGTSLSYIKATC